MILTPKKFSQFKDWNIDMILFSKDLSSTYSMMKLEKIIVPRKEKIKPADIPKKRSIVSKIRFVDGAVFFKDRVIKNDMNKSYLNDLLVSNINFEKGAFCITFIATNQCNNRSIFLFLYYLNKIQNWSIIETKVFFQIHFIIVTLCCLAHSQTKLFYVYTNIDPVLLYVHTVQLTN